MPERILKDCVGFCISLLTKFLIAFLEKDYFPNQLKLKEVTLVIEKDYELRKKIIALLGFFPMHPRFLRK